MNEEPYVKHVHEAIEETVAVYQEAHHIRHWALRSSSMHYLFGVLIRHDPLTRNIRVSSSQKGLVFPLPLTAPLKVA